jgi:Bacterial Ig-like domain (group 2)
MNVGNCRYYISFRFLLLCLCLPLLAAGVGCGGSASAGTGTTKVLTAIAATPGTASVAVGAKQQFTAMATYSDGSTADVTATASWTDTNAKVATITSSGDATAVAAGSTTVTASLDTITGSATLTVAGAAKTLTAIAITPGTASIVAGATQQFTATATYSDNSTANVTTTVAWTTSNAAVAKINSAGIATALTSGSATVTATLSGVSGTANLAVTAPSATLASIAVTPATASIAAKATQQFAATGTYSDGSTANITNTVSWTTSSATVATVSASGLATGVAAGSATVTASLSGVKGTATLTVTPILTSISVSPATPTISVAATQQFTATGTYSDGSTKPVTATWTAANPAIATINASGLATAVASGATLITASSNGISGSTTLTVSGLTLSISPNPASVAVGATQQFTAMATQAGGSPTNVTAMTTWTIGNTAVATVTSGGLATGVAVGNTSVTATYNGITASAPITVSLAAGTGVSVLTWHMDANRSGLNPGETSLTPSNVAPATFGKLFSYSIAGYAYAEPLLVSNVTINGGVHNVLYVATEQDMVYAFDADTYGTGAPLWQKSLLNTSLGETPLTGSEIAPFQGVTSTPVIDPSTNTIYIVSSQTSSSAGDTFRLNALDITTGAQKFGGPVTIQASVPGTNSTAVGGQVSLPGGCIQRAALLLANGNVYMGFGNCHSGWLLAYNAKSLAQVGVFNASPNIDGEGTYGGAGGVWMGSGGPIADSAGNIYISTGNGPWSPTQGSYGDSILKFSPTLAPVSGGNQVQDYFTPQDYLYMNCEDSDLAAGGLMMIPGSGQIVGGGKMGRLYLVNTSNLGQESTGDTGVAQEIYVEQGLISPYLSAPCPDNTPTPGSNHTAMINSYEIFGTAAYFNGSIYLGVTPTSATAPGVVRRIGYSAGSSTPLTAQEGSAPSIQQNTRGTTPFISANGTSDGILWMIDEGQPLGSGTPTKATLRAYDAGNLGNALYNSSANAGDVPGYGIKFSSPVVANGKVYIATGTDLTSVTNPKGEIDVYGLK